jgi:hypothetical protein
MVSRVIGNLVIHLQKVVEFRFGIKIYASFASKVLHCLRVIHGLQEVDRIEKQAVDVFSCACVLGLRVHYDKDRNRQIAVRAG